MSNPYDKEVFLQEEEHHYYGHVADVRDVPFGTYMIGIPLFTVLFVISLVTGLWPLFIVGVLLWKLL